MLSRSSARRTSARNDPGSRRDGRELLMASRRARAGAIELLAAAPRGPGGRLTPEAALVRPNDGPVGRDLDLLRRTAHASRGQRGQERIARANLRVIDLLARRATDEDHGENQASSHRGDRANPCDSEKSSYVAWKGCTAISCTTPLGPCTPLTIRAAAECGVDLRHRRWPPRAPREEEAAERRKSRRCPEAHTPSSPRRLRLSFSRERRKS